MISDADVSEIRSANLCLEPFFLCANRIAPRWQAGDTILSGQVSKGFPFQSSALVEDRNLGCGNDSPACIGDGTENGRKLTLRPRACQKQRVNTGLTVRTSCEKRSTPAWRCRESESDHAAFVAGSVRPSLSFVVRQTLRSAGNGKRKCSSGPIIGGRP